MRCARTHNRRQNLIILLLSKLCDSLRGRALGKHYAQSQTSGESQTVDLLEVLLLLLDGGPFIPTPLCGACGVSGCPGVSNSTRPHGMECFQKCIGAVFHTRSGQAASLPAERVVNGTVLPVGGRSCGVQSPTLRLAQLT